jgi:hypothetical protein
MGIVGTSSDVFSGGFTMLKAKLLITLILVIFIVTVLAATVMGMPGGLDGSGG